MQNKQEIIKKFIILIILTVWVVIDIIYQQKKLNWVVFFEIFLRCVPILLLVIMIVLFQMRKK
jgi:hypothetical protein